MKSLIKLIILSILIINSLSIFESRFYKKSCFNLLAKEECTSNSLTISNNWGDVEACIWCEDSFCVPISSDSIGQNKNCIKGISQLEDFYEDNQPKLSKPNIDRYSSGVLFFFYNFGRKKIDTMPFFYSKPHYASKLKSISTESLKSSDSIGIIIIGFFHVPITGSYEFCLEGLNSEAILLLKESESSDLGDEQLYNSIAEKKEFSDRACSKQIFLRKGIYYYLKIIFFYYLNLTYAKNKKI